MLRVTQLLPGNGPNQGYVDDYLQYFLSPDTIKARYALTNRLMTIPNILSIARLAATPIICTAIVNQHYATSAILFGLAAASDLFDGYIARNVPNQLSKFGAILDPLADKILINAVGVTLTYVGLIPIYVTALIILRDIGILGYIGHVKYGFFKNQEDTDQSTRSQNIKFTPTFLSKVNTALQLTLVTTALGSTVFNYGADHPIMVYLNVATALTTIASGVQYYRLRNTFIVPYR